MANFKQVSDAMIVKILSFPTISNNTLQLFTCKNNELAGFVIRDLIQTDGSVVRVSQVYSMLNGTPVLIGTVSALPGMDLTGGMFSSGCWSDSDPLDPEATFYRADY